MDHLHIQMFGDFSTKKQGDFLVLERRLTIERFCDILYQTLVCQRKRLPKQKALWQGREGK